MTVRTCYLLPGKTFLTHITLSKKGYGVKPITFWLINIYQAPLLSCWNDWRKSNRDYHIQQTNQRNTSCIVIYTNHPPSYIKWERESNKLPITSHQHTSEKACSIKWLWMLLTSSHENYPQWCKLHVTLIIPCNHHWTDSIINVCSTYMTIIVRLYYQNSCCQSSSTLVKRGVKWVCSGGSGSLTGERLYCMRYEYTLQILGDGSV